MLQPGAGLPMRGCYVKKRLQEKPPSSPDTEDTVPKSSEAISGRPASHEAPGERQRPWPPVLSTLIYNLRDAVLVDAFTLEQARAQADSVRLVRLALFCVKMHGIGPSSATFSPNLDPSRWGEPQILAGTAQGD